MKVIISLTTIPSRLKDEKDQGIKLCIDSLINQSYDNYEIHFNVPDKNKYTNEEYIIPEWFSKLPDHFKIFRTKDYGSITKIVPTILRDGDPDDIIIVCDDDLVYHKDMVTEQVKNQSRFPGDCAVGYDGMRLKKGIFGDIRDHYFTSNKCDGEVRVLQGYKTVSYRRRFFTEELLTDEFMGKSWADDIILSAFMAYRGIKKIVTFHPNDPEFKTLKEWQSQGGVTTFPVLRHTHHESLEGCNLLRDRKEPCDDNHLWKKYIDKF